MTALTEMTPNGCDPPDHRKRAARTRRRWVSDAALSGARWPRPCGDLKYVICNGDEGDPGAFMDRSVLESDPQRVMEGMAIAAYAVGASKGYIYVRAEYPLAVQRLTRPACAMRAGAGLLGNNICNTPFNFDVEIRLGAGAFVCGEETALIASIEGRRGTPKPRPPYPAVSGLWGKPTLDQQRGDVRQHCAHHPQGRQMVCEHGLGAQQRNKSIRTDRKDHEHRPG